MSNHTLLCLIVITHNSYVTILEHNLFGLHNKVEDDFTTDKDIPAYQISLLSTQICTSSFTHLLSCIS